MKTCYRVDFKHSTISEETYVGEFKDGDFIDDDNGTLGVAGEQVFLAHEQAYNAVLHRLRLDIGFYQRKLDSALRRLAVLLDPHEHPGG